jgi:hypothetical protein
LPLAHCSLGLCGRAWLALGGSLGVGHRARGGNLFLCDAPLPLLNLSLLNPRTHALLRPAGGTKKGVGARHGCDREFEFLVQYGKNIWTGNIYFLFNYLMEANYTSRLSFKKKDVTCQQGVVVNVYQKIPPQSS